MILQFSLNTNFLFHAIGEECTFWTSGLIFCPWFQIPDGPDTHNIFVIRYNPRCLLLVPTQSFQHFASLDSKSLRCQEPGISPSPCRSWFGMFSPHTRQEQHYWKKENSISKRLGSDQLKAISLDKTQTNKQTTTKKKTLQS